MPPSLPVELLEEIFLRLPPDEPASLVRASLTSKHWLGLLTSARFRGFYRDLHRAPPMLGFVYSCTMKEEEEEDAEEDDADDDDDEEEEEEDNNLLHFVATAKFDVRVPAFEDWKDYAAWDCRHGRVLFSNNDVIPMRLVVWDPMTGRRTLMYGPEDYDSSGAAVLCSNATTGCDHRACHAGPFQVVYVGLYNTDDGCVAYARVSLPDVGKWSESCPPLDLPTRQTFLVDSSPPVFVRGSLHFMLVYEYDDDGVGAYGRIAVLKYDLGSSCLSLIDRPPMGNCHGGQIVLMAMEDASLGFAQVGGLTLNLWSMHIGSNGVMTWTQHRVIDLETLLPVQNPQERVRLIGSVEYNDIIFATMGLGIYEINLKSLRLKKIWKREECRALFPYMSFYNPPERVSLSDVAH